MWVLDHLADLESDFSAIHRVDDMYSLPGPLFFQRALRMAAYKGVMRARVEEQVAKEERRKGGRAAQPTDGRRSMAQLRTEAADAQDPTVEIVKVGGDG